MADLSTERLSYQASLIALLESLGTGSSSESVSSVRLAIVNMVKIKLDELVPEGEGVVYDLESEPNVSDPLTLYINGLLDESAKNLLQNAPKDLLPVTDSGIASGTQYSDAKIGYVEIPDTYLRLYSFKMGEWEREVTEPISKEHPKYKRQTNPFVRGGVSKPVVILNQKNISGTVTRILEYFSVPGELHTIDKFLFIAETAAEDINDNLYDSLAWICAGKILQNIKEFDQSKLAFEQAKLCYSNLL